MSKKSPGKVLKDKGLIPQNWNLNKLSRGQKSWVTKQTRTFAAVIKAPREFITLPTKNKREKSEAKAAGLPVTNKRAIVHAPKGGRVRRVKGHIVVTTKTENKEYFIADARGFPELLDTVRDIPLKRNQVWVLSMDGNEHNIQFTSISDLMQYYTRVNWEKEQQTQYVVFVLITENGGDDGEGFNF